RWKVFMESGPKIKDLIAFHTSLKLTALAHSPKHYSALGRLVAQVKRYRPAVLYSEYIRKLMEGLRLIATVKKNTNVLLHVAGYFKKQMTPEDKRELLEVIEQYHKGHIPLIVPIVLINHCVRKFDEPYLKNQFYLNPHPLELMLRNHV
ncbi:MAG: YbgA family protein, partial [Nitrospirota bacterium]